MLKCVSWNVNSIRMRLPVLKRMIKEENPHFILLQETRCQDHEFPHEAFPDYVCHIWGQKKQNGVAILVKQNLYIEDVERISLGATDDSRCIKLRFNDINIVSVYVPCGSLTGSVYEYKIKYLESLNEYLASLQESKMIVGGDFNVALTDEDVECIKDFRKGVLCLPIFREKLHNLLLNNQLEDIHDPKQYTWWDYRSPYKGLRIDYIFTRGIDTKQIVKSEYRRLYLKQQEMYNKGKLKIMDINPSDHVPLIIRLL